MNIREIAKRAKVSTATVSRTVNRIPTVDPRLAKRVWKVIDDVRDTGRIFRHAHLSRDGVTF